MTSGKHSADRLPPSVAALFPNARPYMPDQRKTGIKLPALDQICIVVKDVDRAVEFYASVFGLGPFYIVEVPLEMTYRGQQGSRSRLKIAFVLSGEVEIELIQVLEGETPHSEFLREKREGIHHVRFSVDGLEDMLAELAGEGIGAVWYNTYEGGGMAYLGQDQVGGTMFELVQLKQGKT